FSIVVFFFFQAEDGIRDGHVTGVQTCALPILGLLTSSRSCFSLSSVRLPSAARVRSSRSAISRFISEQIRSSRPRLRLRRANIRLTEDSESFNPFAT